MSTDEVDLDFWLAIPDDEAAGVKEHAPVRTCRLFALPSWKRLLIATGILSSDHM